MDIIQHSFIWNRCVSRLLLGKEQEMKCENCSHAEMCKWIDELEGRGCDFGEPCDDAISREYLFKVLDDFCGHDRTATITLDTLADIVYDMPSVTPSRQVIENIKADIEAARYGLINDGLDVALRIIDKHIEGR